jgi:hypothetical protein
MYSVILDKIRVRIHEFVYSCLREHKSSLPIHSYVRVFASKFVDGFLSFRAQPNLMNTRTPSHLLKYERCKEG